MRRWTPGTDPLAPMPYTAVETADLVARTRMAEAEVAEHSHKASSAARRLSNPLTREQLEARRADRAAAREQALAHARSLAAAVRLPQKRSQQCPPGATCAICAGPAVGELRREPLGKDDALVNVCGCCAAHPAMHRGGR